MTNTKDQKSVSAEDASLNARIFSMPDVYRHGAVAKMVEPVVVQKPVAPPLPIAPPVLPPLTSASAKLTQPKKTSRTTKALLISGVVVLIALLIGAYLVLRSQQKNQEAISQEETLAPVIEAPVVVTPPDTTTAPDPSLAGGEIAEAPVSPFVKASTPGIDTDSDGATDIEETLVYGSNPYLPDTDGDGFLDGNEVFHRYDPSALKPGTTLLESRLAERLNAVTYQLLFPSKWLVQPSDTKGYVLAVSTGERFLMEFIEKSPDVSLADWYLTLKKEGVPQASKTKSGFPLLVSLDQLNAYVDLGVGVIVFTYETGSKGMIDYLQTFQMMVNSVEKIPVSSSASVPALAPIP